ncbi:MAG: DUF370 domain-containing protein [Clostridiales bacterium]|nr:DUF370 domain-containing protein [Candidatus Coliplasma caballi]
MKQMFLQLERGEGLRARDVIGVFDFDAATVSAETREALKQAQSEMKLTNLASDLPRSIVLADEPYGTRVYTSGLSTETIVKRS